MADRKLTSSFRQILVLLPLYILAGRLYFRDSMGTWEFTACIRLGILVLMPFSLRLLSLSLPRILFLPPLLILESMVLPLAWNLPMLLLFLTADLLLLCRFAREHWLPVCLSVLPAAMTLLLYDGIFCTLAVQPYYSYFRKTGGGPFAKGMLILTVTALFSGIFFFLFRALAKRFAHHFTAAVRCPGLEGYVLVIFCSALLFLGIVDLVCIPDLFHDSLLQTHSYACRSLRYVWTLTQFFILVLHGLYICLLLRAISLTRRMQTSEANHAALSRFTEGLEQNLRDLRGVRHDIKNLLLTMGGFVARSRDPELQRFWQEQITPCLEDTVRRSTILDSLREITDEQLKSFLYFKLMQAVDLGVPAELKISLQGKTIPVTGDLIRLIGIFLDNALEETHRAGGTLTLSITALPDVFQIRVTNPVLPETAVRGIRAGVSDKGPGRGSGLLTAEEIVKRHGGICWNSCLTDTLFSQILLLPY